MRISLILFILLSSYACGSTATPMIEKKSKVGSKDAATEEGEKVPPVAEKAGPAPVDQGVEQLPPAASIPVSVGGAYLTCSLVAGADKNAACVAYDDNGKASPLRPKGVFISKPGSLKWTPTEFIFDEKLGSMAFALPLDSQAQAFSIAMLTQENVLLVGWILNAANLKNLVSDGGFEEHVLDLKNEIETQFIGPEKQTAWKAKSPDGSGCLDIIELRSKFMSTGATPFEGNQVTELDSNCDKVNFNKGNNVYLYQDLTLKPEYFYLVSFYYQSRSTGTKPQGVRAKFGSQIILESSVTSEAWVRHTKILRASEVVTRLSFHEIGDSSDGRGTQLDNVSVSELGPLPPLSL